MADVDGDDVRCRWAESSQGECGGVCSAFTGATLTGVRVHLCGMTLAQLHTTQIHGTLLSYCNTTPMEEEIVYNI